MGTHPSFSAYLKSTGSSQVAFAKMSGVPQSQISAYLAGRRIPGVKNALAIERATGGAVTVESWEGAPPPKRRKPARRTAARVGAPHGQG